MCTNHDEFFYVEDYFQDLNPNTHMFTGEEEDEDEKFTKELNPINMNPRFNHKFRASLDH